MLREREGENDMEVYAGTRVPGHQLLHEDIFSVLYRGPLPFTNEV